MMRSEQPCKAWGCRGVTTSRTGLCPKCEAKAHGPRWWNELATAREREEAENRKKWERWRELFMKGRNQGTLTDEEREELRVLSDQLADWFKSNAAKPSSVFEVASCGCTVNAGWRCQLHGAP